MNYTDHVDGWSYMGGMILGIGLTVMGLFLLWPYIKCVFVSAWRRLCSPVRNKEPR